MECCLLEVITARFDTKFQKTTIIQVYSPTNNADEEEKDDFYNSLQTTVNSVPKRDILMILGDLNAKVGKDRTGREREMGPNGIGEMNENGEIFADFCAVNSLVIGGTLFPHKNCHKVTWVSPNGVTENQIDHIAISQRWRSSLQDVRNKRGADIASDHHLIIAKIQLKLLSTKKAKSRRKKFNVDLFKDPKVVQDYHILLQNKFSVLENLHDDETSINTAWEMTRDSIVQACEETVGYLQQNRKQWMSENTWKIVNERRQVKEKVLTAITRQQKKQTQEQYSNKDKEVKKSCKQDKRNFVEQLAKEAEAACSKGDTKTLYNITKQLSGKPPTSNTPIKDKDNNTLTKLEDQLERWKEHFEQRLHNKNDVKDKDIALLTAKLMEENKEHSRGWYRINAIRSLTGGAKLTPQMNERTEELLRTLVACGEMGSQVSLTELSQGGEKAIIEFTAPSTSILECDKRVKIGIARHGNINRRVRYRVETFDGTAVATEDYIEFKQSLVFEPGETMNYIEIDIVDDDIWEEDEVFFAKISIDPSEPGVVGRRAITQIIVLNDDIRDTIRFPKPAFVFKESVGTALVPVEREGGCKDKVT
ncbi:Craniofacial development protein 2 [Mytilus edulis]|uniref:Craniofacial development protein 2 n=1 Tax=Mytilus edulis TaxID=6550 RepID=A0A8S3QK91_MYTED|nr:Craniofacial development protein 2 [Mytilus edulis]